MKYAVLYLKTHDRSNGMRSYECLETFETLPKAQEYMRKCHSKQVTALGSALGIKYSGEMSDYGYTIFVETKTGGITDIDQVVIREIAA